MVGWVRWYIGYIITVERKGVVCDWMAQLVLGPPAPMLHIVSVTARLASCSSCGNTLPVYSLYITTPKIRFSFTCCSGMSQWPQCGNTLFNIQQIQYISFTLFTAVHFASCPDYSHNDSWNQHTLETEKRPKNTLYFLANWATFCNKFKNKNFILSKVSNIFLTEKWVYTQNYEAKSSDMMNSPL